MNLRQLLAIPVVFTFAWWTAPNFLPQPAEQPWERLPIIIQSINYEIAVFLAPIAELDVEMIHRYLDRAPKNTDPMRIRKVSMRSVDVWQNPFRAIESVGKNGEKIFLVYSTGRDGKSDSNGNDLDDINSWSNDPLKFYRREKNEGQRFVRLACAIVETFILYTPIYLVLCRRKGA